MILCFDSDIDGVLRSANNTEFGLASGVFTKDMSKALRVADSLQAGTVFVNTYNKTDVASPFGGFKQSGFGKDLGKYLLLLLLLPCTKTIHVFYSSIEGFRIRCSPDKSPLNFDCSEPILYMSPKVS